MTERRIQFNNIVQNQLPTYVREEFPLVAEFLKQYYISQEFQGASTDLIQNIDKYIKLDNIKKQAEFATLAENISFSDDVITVSSQSGTQGFPDSYGLLQIDSEIITYTGKTSNSFTGCVRGFSGVVSNKSTSKSDELVFSTSESTEHLAGAKIANLSSIFLSEFFTKIKYQIAPGFENREFYSGVDKYLFLKQSKDFYSTRGTEASFKILFKILYGEDVKVIKPQDYLTKPSDSNYVVTNDMVVEVIEGDPYKLENATLFQDNYEDIPNVSLAYVPIYKVERIFSDSDKEYYKLSFDAGYNRDLGVNGTLYGDFVTHPRTKLIGQVSSGESTINVDSTVGFPLSGSLDITYSNGVTDTITYTSKSINQFFGCYNISATILDGSDINLSVYARNEDGSVKVRITSVLNEVDILDESYYYSVGDTGIIKTLGVNPKDNISNNWIFNTLTDHEVLSIQVLDLNNRVYKITTKYSNKLKVEDSISIISNTGDTLTSKVTGIISDNEFITQVLGSLDISVPYRVRRNILNVNYPNYPNTSNIIADIQNVYHEKNKTLVASSSIPHYSIPLEASTRTIKFSGTFSATPTNPLDTFNIGTHNFYTGDLVYYIPGTNQLFEEGLYFIKRESSTTIKLAKSRSNIYESIFIELVDTVESNDNSLVEYELYQKTLESQKLLREIAPPIDDGFEYDTEPGPIGIFINGTELLNYKSRDKIYYGPIESIEVSSSGGGYDVINPPQLIIEDPVGSGATGYCSVNGSLQGIRIIDPGFDYLEEPKVNITGGNGSGAIAKAKTKLVDHKVFFNSQSTFGLVNLVNNTIAFSTYHKFRDAESVIYRTEGQDAVGGISTDSVYYVSVQGPQSVKLHSSYSDAISRVNEISLTSYGEGNHILEATNKKKIIASINVEESGSGYENKKRTANPLDVSQSYRRIKIKNHGFNSGEVVKYTTTGNVIGGLNNSESYYVTKIDEDNFSLSYINSEINNEDFYYKTNQYVKLTSIGSGIHIFNYPEISVDIVGRVGVSSISGKTFNATVQPIFRGEVTSVHLEKTGVGYGSSEILNFSREPLVNLTTGTGAKLTPIINGGKIVDVLVEDSGSGYNSPPDLIISTEQGNGVGAVLTPIIQNGQIVSVNILENGIGYDRYKTAISVIPSGTGAKFNSIIKTWNINLFERYFNIIKDDDGFIFYNPVSQYGLQYTHLYTPRKLRESVYSRELGDNVLYGKYDLPKVNSTEVSSDSHSPIIGWAYDGNPIYGPYGYSRKDGGQITQIRSGYRLNPKQNRPPFPLGFFVEDYEHLDIDDDTVLDKHNGRFCVTPDFPNGVYAYFTTTEPATDRTKFNGYRIPEFPYVIGSTYKSVPNKFNFSGASNQDDIDLNKTKWARNTSLYNLTTKEQSYSYITLPNKLNQTIDVKYASPGVVDNILINFGGKNYKVNDKIVFNDAETGGYGLTSKVSRISGKPVNNISFASTVLYYNNEIYATQGSPNSFTVQSESPYDLKNGQIISISGLSTTNILPQGFYVVSGIVTNTFAISNINGLPDSTSTGIVTYISVSGNIAYSNVRENDIYRIGEEKVKILNVDKESSRLRIMREIDGTVGTSHSYSDILYEQPRRFTIRTGISTTFNFKTNKEIYFNPTESLGIGSISGVGIGSTLVFGNPGAGVTQVFIPTKTIYLPNHNLETGDSIIYSTNGGDGILVSSVGIGTTFLTNNSRLYVAKLNNDLIGISTVKVGIGSTGTIIGVANTDSSITTLYLIEPGLGDNHSFKTEYPTLNAQLTRSIVTVSTASTHGLSDGDDVFISVNSGISSIITVKYDDFNRKLLINPRSFTSNDVDLETNTIRIVDHKLKTGQKISFASTESYGDLVNNEIYYAVVYNKDRIKLAPSYHEATKLVPNSIGIDLNSKGTISPINPPIKAYKNSSLIFDVSDESLSFLSGSSKFSAFKFNFYLDSNFTQIFDTSKTSDVFEVKRFGRLGIDSNARVSLNINDNVPRKLFYKLDPVYNANLPTEKSEINVDDSVLSHNQIEIVPSVYNGNYKVRVPSQSTFTYDLIGIPEVFQYDSSNSTISYETTSTSALGSISKIDLQSKGQNYYSLPKFSKVISNSGSGAILEVESKSVGKIRKTTINDIGFDFPSDYTLRPNLSLPQIVILEPLNSIGSIGISSVGKGYTVPPKLIVIDGKTNNQIEDVDLRYSLGDSYVTVLKNTYSLNDIEPIIIPTQNPNGVGISSISYDKDSKTVTVSMSVGFTTDNTFPFSVGDRVLIENVNVGIGTSVVGYNSKNYGYQLFTLTSVDPNIGGIGTVGYSLDGYLRDGENPGSFDLDFSSGRIIPEKHFPIFKTQLRQNNFFIGEKVRYLGENEPIGIVEGWDRKSYNLRISSKKIIENNRELQGVSSKTQGTISSAKKFDGFINHGAYSKVEKGSEFETGILNNTLQRIQDNFYYQNFSYSLKSKVSYDVWEDIVGTLNHTAGFKKFSDYQLESSGYCGISTDSIGDLESFTEVDSVVNLNCVYDFDLVRENSIDSDSSYFSDNISYKNKILADYFELVGNRVLFIDDISQSFNSDPRFELFTEVDRFRIADIRSKKYIFYIRDRRFYSERQTILVTLIHDGLEVCLNQYARIESYIDLGSFDFRVEGDEGVLLFYPTKNKVNDYNITQLSYNTEDSFSGLGNTSLGGIVDIESKSVIVSLGSTTNIVSLGSSYTSSKLLLTANSNDGRYQFDEINLINDGSESYILEYGQLVTGEIGYESTVGFGTYNAYLSGSELKLDFIPDSGISAKVNALQVSFNNTISTGISTVFMKYAGLKATATSISPTLLPVPVKISEHPSAYYGAYYIVQVSDIDNNRHEILEISTLDDESDLYITNYGALQTHSGLGTFGVSKGGGITSLNFTPLKSLNIEIKVFSNYVTDSTDDSEEPTEFNEKMFRTSGSIYYGTENELNNSFELNYKGFPIFQKIFDGSDLGIVNILNNTITIPNHFFVTGEELHYSFGDFNLGNRPIKIASTDFGVGIGITNTLPSKVYAISLDQNRIRLAKSSEDALSGIPIPISFTDKGSGTSHSFSATNQNSKCLIAIDNIVQSPIVATATTTRLSETLPETENILFVDNEKLFSTGELIIIDNEISRVRGVGIGSTNTLLVTRSVLGTNIETHSAGKVVSKLSGSYNIINNTIHFSSPPYGNIPYSSDTNPPDERDWIGIATNSTFQGRVFLRSAEQDSLDETYTKNYIFDDIAPQFTGSQNSFNLTSNGNNVSNIYHQNAIILINDVFQEPGRSRSYTLDEGTVGITSISFVGTATSTLSDINTSGLPRGGVIVSVGSTEGLGYQPLISAGGVAVVSSAGTIASISIGNSGSGYRSAVQTPDGIKPVTVNVGIQTYSTDTPNIQFIGTATVTNGNITSVSIANTDVFYAPRPISNLLYDNTSGLTTVVTSTPHNLNKGEVITLTGIAMTCDYAAPVNVIDAIYDHTTGITTIITSEPHGLSTTGANGLSVSGNKVILSGLGFTCNDDGGATIHYYPRPSDPGYCGVDIISINSSTEFTVGVGTHTTEHFYTSGGTVQASVTFPRESDPIKENGGIIVTNVISDNEFEINSGISTRKHFYSRCGNVERVFDVVFDSPISYSSLPLVYSSPSSGNGVQATIDIVVGQGSSVIDFEIKNLGYNYEIGDTLTIDVGGVAGIPTVYGSTFSNFEISVQETFRDKFNGWSIGELQVFDKIEKYFNNRRTLFSLKYEDIPISLYTRKGSPISIQDTLIVFLNEVLQVPGESYIFNGGNKIEFTEPPKEGDTCKILFYKGTGDGVDVIFTDAFKTIKTGDDIILTYDSSLNQSPSLLENPRTIFDVLPSDTKTNPYFGPGNTQDENIYRPINWCRQTDDKIIDGQFVGKDRNLYEPSIIPTANLIANLGIGDTTVYVDNLRPFFDQKNESQINLDFQKSVTFISKDTLVSASATAVVSAAGTISSIIINDGGFGYEYEPKVYIQAPLTGVSTITSTAVSSVISGQVNSISIVGVVSGYTQENPPVILIEPPTAKIERNRIQNYEGDFGIIVGLGVTLRNAYNQIVMDLYIPQDSALKDSNLVGIPIVQSSLRPGDYFVVYNSNTNVGSGITSFISVGLDNNNISTNSQQIDNIYQVSYAENIIKDLPNIGPSFVRRVYSRISGIGSTNFSRDNITFDSDILTFDSIDVSTDGNIGIISTTNYFGNYSWGKIALRTRSKAIEYNPIVSIGSTITSSVAVTRQVPLKSSNYII